MVTRTRFAPSPTGDLHIGGVRTALFSYLFAKNHKGEFVLRIEDTDATRSTEASLMVILEGMAWLGLHSDEPPIHQSEKLPRYQQVVQILMEEGKAYRCYCSKERLAALREDQMAKLEKPRYDGHCRDLKEENLEAPHVIRFKTPLEGAVTFKDLIHGEITVQNEELDDLVMIRQDGMPTYNLSVVVDDHDTNITDVIRGDDHINNTPRQINIYQAMGWTAPNFAHVPMILGPDGKRLSKRHGATNVLTYQQDGYLPEALLNYLVRLGWSHGDQEIFSMEEMIEFFDCKHINKSCAAINPEKLDWLNQHYMREKPTAELAELAKPFFIQEGLNVDNGPALADIIPLQVERVKTLVELAQRSRFFFELETYEPEALEKLKKNDDVLGVLQTAIKAFDALNDWSDEAIHICIKSLCDISGKKMGQVGPPIRVVTTGTMQSPALDKTLAVLGKVEVLERLRKAEKFFT